MSPLAFAMLALAVSEHPKRTRRRRLRNSAGCRTALNLFWTDRIKREQGMDSTTFKIDGMHCDGCAQRITTLLERQPGVRDARVSYSTGAAQVSYNPHAMTKAELIDIIERAGFAVEAG